MNEIEQKAIEEMANAMCGHKDCDCERCLRESKLAGINDDCDCITMATAAYKKGYRKQSDTASDVIRKVFEKSRIDAAHSYMHGLLIIRESDLDEVAASFGGEENDGQR